MKLFNLKNILTALIIAISGVLPAMARYTLYNHEGNVSVIRNGQRVALKKDMELSVLDVVVIGKGGVIEIFNDQNSQIYKSKSTGEFSVTRIIIDAKGQATSHLEGINDKMRFGKSNDETQARVYAAKGMVTHALEVFDPEGKDLQVDPMVLGRHIVTSISDTAAINDTPFPAILKKETAGEESRSFRIENTLNFPIYFNIVKVNDDNAGNIRISELGQPTGCYVVLPGQALSREQFAGFDSKSLHLLIMTHCYFDIDKVIENMSELITSGESASEDADISLPLYIRTI